MKLNTPELLEEVQEVFAIRIPREEAVQITTAEEVFNWLFEATNLPKDSSVSLSALAFFSLRREAIRLGASGPLQLSDSTLEILPAFNRRKYWSALQRRCQLSLPPLRRPAWLVSSCALLLIICSALFGILVSQSNQSPLTGFVAALALALELGLIFAFLTRRFAVRLPPDCETLSDLASSTVKLNAATLAERYGITN